MQPLIWTNRACAAVAGLLVAWLFSIELGTSRTASRTAATRRTESEEVIDTATSRLCDAALAVAVAGGLAASLRAPTNTFRHQRISFALGASALGSSGVLSKVARRHLGRFHRNALTVHADHRVVNTGPYSIVRHPLYSATVGAMVGIGLVLGNRVSLGLSALPLAALVHRIDVEEAMLTRALGDNYTSYKERTWRLLPGVW